MPYQIKGGFSTKDPNALEKIAKAMGKENVMGLMPVKGKLKKVESTMVKEETLTKSKSKTKKK